jgi:hypothetical protein
VHVFDDEDYRPQSALTEDDGAQELVRAAPELGALHAKEELRRHRKAQEMVKQERGLLALDSEHGEPRGNSPPDLLGRELLEEIEVSPVQLDQRTVRHGATEGRAGRFELQVPASVQAPQELVEQAGFAHARLAGDDDHPSETAGGLSERPGQPLPLHGTADQGRQPAFLRHLQSGSPADLALHGVGALGLALALDLEIAQVLEHEEALTEPLGVPTGHDLSGLRDIEQPRREVHGVAQGRVVHSEIAANGAHHDRPSVDADSHAKVPSMGALDIGPEWLELLLNRQRGPQGAPGMIFMGDWRSEQRHHAVPEELINRPLVAMDHGENHLEGAVHDGVDFLGIQALRHRGEPRDVGEHDCHLLALSLDRDP